MISKLSIFTLASLALIAFIAGCGGGAEDLGTPYEADELMAAYNNDSDAFETDWVGTRMNVSGTVEAVSRGEVHLATSFDGETVVLIGLSDEVLDEVEVGGAAAFACVVGGYNRGAIDMEQCGPAQYGADGATDADGEGGATATDTDASGTRSIMEYWSVPLLVIAAALTVMAVPRANWRAGLQPAMVALMVLGVFALSWAAASVLLDYKGLNLTVLNILAGASFPLIIVMGWIILDPDRFPFLPPSVTGYEPPPPPVFAPPPPTDYSAPGDMGATAAGPGDMAGGGMAGGGMAGGGMAGGGDMGATAVAGPGIGAAAAPGPSETMAMQPDVARSLAWLVVTQGPSEGKSMQLKEGNNTIGRGLDNDLQIEDASVSRSHAMLSVKGEEFTLVDLGSASGTRVGDRRIAGVPVSAGGVITVGQTRLGVVNVDVTQGTPSSGATIVTAATGHSLSLVAQSGPDAGRSFPLASAQNVIGRDPSAQVVLSDPNVSRRHAMVRVDADRATIADLGSMSGTSVNGESIRGVRIAMGDKIAIGQSEFTLMRPSV